MCVGAYYSLGERKTIGFNSSPAENPLFFGHRQLRYCALDRGHPTSVRGCQSHDWPIGAKHESVRREYLDNCFDIGRYNLIRPGMPVRFGYHSGDLTVNIRSPSQLPHVFSPWGENAITNEWFGDMVEDEDLIRMSIYELNRLGKMSLKDQDVVSEIELLQCGYAAIEVVAQYELIVRFVMNRMTYRFHFGERGDTFEFRHNSRACERRPTHDSADQIV